MELSGRAVASADSNAIQALGPSGFEQSCNLAAIVFLDDPKRSIGFSFTGLAVLAKSLSPLLQPGQRLSQRSSNQGGIHRQSHKH